MLDNLSKDQVHLQCRRIALVEKTGGKKRTQSNCKETSCQIRNSPGNVKGQCLGISIATPEISSTSDTSLSYNSHPLNTQPSTTSFSTEKAPEQRLTFSRETMLLGTTLYP